MVCYNFFSISSLRVKKKFFKLFLEKNFKLDIFQLKILIFFNFIYK